MSEAPRADHRTLPRRRGAVLRDAILAAAHEELTEVGYAAMTLDHVAERAGASKASLYRRWPGRAELAVDAVRRAVPDAGAPADTGTLRGDLLALLRAAADRLSGPTGQVLRAVLVEALTDPARTAALRELSRGTVAAAVAQVVGRAVARGEVERLPAPRSLAVGPAVLRDHVLLGGPLALEAFLVEVVDDVLVPLYTDGRPSS